MPGLMDTHIGSEPSETDWNDWSDPPTEAQIKKRNRFVKILQQMEEEERQEITKSYGKAKAIYDLRNDSQYLRMRGMTRAKKEGIPRWDQPPELRDLIL